MCTLSWLVFEEGGSLFFSRDEQRTRPSGLAPDYREWDAGPAWAPMDPPSGGTWLAVTPKGLIFCLLNFQADHRVQGNISRGRIVPSLVGMDDLFSVRESLETFPLNETQPFTLAAIDLKGGSLMVRWDGVRLQTIGSVPPMVSSSSWNTAEVLAARQRRFEKMVAQRGWREDTLRAFHCDGVAGPEEVLMSRPDACTHSIVQVRWGKTVEIIYWDHPKASKKDGPSKTILFPRPHKEFR